MKILVKFDSSIGLDPVEKQLSANETVENLEVLISLNYGEMDTCKLKYNKQTLANKDAKLRDIFSIKSEKDGEAEPRYEVEVVKKGEFDEITNFALRIKNSAEQNPLVFGGVVAALVFLILFILGSASGSDQ